MTDREVWVAIAVAAIRWQYLGREQAFDLADEAVTRAPKNETITALEAILRDPMPDSEDVVGTRDALVNARQQARIALKVS